MGLNAIWNYRNQVDSYKAEQDSQERTIRIDPRDLKALAQIVRKDNTADISDSRSILEDVKSKYQAKIDKLDTKKQRLVNEVKVINNSKPILSSLSTAAQNLAGGFGQSIFTNMATNGLPSSVSMQVSNIGATPGQHTISVNTVASKQIIEIRSKDAAGNARPFGNGNVTGGGPGQFTAGQNFAIYQDSNKQTLLATVNIPVAPQTLQNIADAINASMIGPAFPVVPLQGRPLSTYLTASVQADGDGQKLVLTSNNAGAAGNFYIDDMDITGLNRARAARPNSAIAGKLSVLTPNNDVQSIDIYSSNGLPFAGHDSFGDNHENFTFNAGATWNIGSSPIIINNATSLDVIAAEINSYRNLSGVSAQVVEVGDGFILRVTSAGSPLNYTPDSTINILQTGAATAAQVRPTSGVDSTFTLDGDTYNAGGNLTLANPVRGIDSVTISEQAPLSRFAITQDTVSLTSAINSLVTAVNDAKQFIAQQKLPGAPLSRGSSVILRQMQSFVNKFTLGSTNNMSMTQLGISEISYTPTDQETRQGIVPYKKLSVDTTKLQNILASNFSAVQGFFAGSLSVGVASPNGSTLSVNAMSKVLNIPAGFNLTITGNGPGVITVQDGAAIGLTWASTGGNSGVISGQAGTIYDGLYLNYTFGGANLATFNAPDNINNITIYNGIGQTVSTSVSSYTSQYGQLNQTIQRMERRVGDVYNKRIDQITKRMNKALFVAKLRLDESKNKEQEFKRFLDRQAGEAA